MNLILFGFKSCGKTTLGELLARRLSLPFLDTDRLVEELYFMRYHKKMNCRNIAKTIGEEGFRALESDVLEQLKETRNSIISLGGGAILNPQNAALLAKLGQLVYLKLNKQTLKSRILGSELPSFLDPSDPEASFEKMYAERQPVYEKILALSVDLEIKTQDQVVQELSTLIEQEEAVHGQ